jgi:hypothetical protein
MSNIDAIVHAHGDYYVAVDDAPPDLRALAKEATGSHVRRVGRFIQLALIGACRCAGAASPPPETAVYLASRRGDIEMTAEVMEHVFRDAQQPKPLTFINTVSNAACFYVARHFGLHGRSCFVGGASFSFETALQLALLDLQMGVARTALVGCVELAVAPLDVDRRRLGVAPNAPVGEASHWLWLDIAKRPGPGVRTVEFFADRERLRSWIASQRLDPAQTQFAPGQFLSDADASWLERECNLTRRFDYRTGRAYYDCHSGAAIGVFLREGADETMLHVNGDEDGRYAVMLARR